MRLLNLEQGLQSAKQRDLRLCLAPATLLERLGNHHVAVAARLKALELRVLRDFRAFLTGALRSGTLAAQKLKDMS